MDGSLMARETKVGLLIGLGMILLIGIIVSDHLAVMDKHADRGELTTFANHAQKSIDGDTGQDTEPRQAQASNNRQRVIRTPAELRRKRDNQANRQQTASRDQAMPRAQA
jgi:hypothetical protein